jgi:hypothetical protein
MDIEGSEGGLLDDNLLPNCNKLVLEYHLSRDSSMEALQRRIAYLKRIFVTVKYPAGLDRQMVQGGNQKSFYDRKIWCWGQR